MTKKSTLLQLDNNLVTLAKKHGLNISELTEAAIRSRLHMHLSCSERLRNFHQHLEDLKVQGDCYVLPKMIRTVRIENVGPIEKLEMAFDKGLNVILGPNASGKTAFVRALAHAFGVSKSDEPYYAVRHDKLAAVVEVETYSEGIRLRYERQDDSVAVSRFNGAVLLDEPVAAAIRETDKHMFLARVCKEFDQAIVVSRDESLAKMPNCRILRLTRTSP